MSVDFAKSIIDKTQFRAKTSTTTSATGDLAYVPYTKDMTSVVVSGKTYTIPEEIRKYAYISGENAWDGSGVVTGGVKGVYYYDSDATMPIYSPKPLTDNGTTLTKDPAEFNVTKVGGKYYLANDPLYKTTWDNAITAAGDPCKTNTTTQAENEQGNLLYTATQFVYRDAEGKSLSQLKIGHASSAKVQTHLSRLQSTAIQHLLIIVVLFQRLSTECLM